MPTHSHTYICIYISTNIHTCKYAQVHHDIGTHVVHHLFPQIPHYNLCEATEAVKPLMGPYYREVCVCMCACKYVIRCRMCACKYVIMCRMCVSVHVKYVILCRMCVCMYECKHLYVYGCIAVKPLMGPYYREVCVCVYACKSLVSSPFT